MEKRFNCILYVVTAISLLTCKTSYTPAPVTDVTNYLVVEGMINITDSTYIKLSRTVGVMSGSAVKPELKATISIESSQGSSYPLKELSNGSYAASPLNSSFANQYRLRIKTANGEQYISDFGAALISPPIDSVTWKAKSTGLEIYVNTHDPNKATQYYRWDYTEAWEFHPNYQSSYVSNGDSIKTRTPAQQIWDCYTGGVSNTIRMGTSVTLSKDIIDQAVVAVIPTDAEKISVKYSILVKQYALTKDAYDYWSLLKKNTEQLGSIFDSQPSASIGNIHCVTSPAESVIGYISAGKTSTQRIFITKSQLPLWVTTPFYPVCVSDSVWLRPGLPVGRLLEDVVINYNSKLFRSPLTQQIPIYPFGDSKGDPGYVSADPICVDCTLRGSKTPPSYWK